MGTDIYLKLDPEARVRMEREREQGTIPLQKLPDSHLFSMGGYPFLLSGLTSLGAALRREPSPEDADHKRSYFEYIADGREEAMRASGKHLDYVKSWRDFAEESQSILVTPGGLPLDGVLADVGHEDAHTLLGKLLFLPPPKTPEGNLLVASATFWVASTCAQQLETLSEAESETRQALRITGYTFHVIGLYAVYAWRYGGSYAVSS